MPPGTTGEVEGAISALTAFGADLDVPDQDDLTKQDHFLVTHWWGMLRPLLPTSPSGGEGGASSSTAKQHGDCLPVQVKREMPVSRARSRTTRGKCVPGHAAETTAIELNEFQNDQEPGRKKVKGAHLWEHIEVRHPPYRPQGLAIYMEEMFGIMTDQFARIRVLTEKYVKLTEKTKEQNVERYRWSWRWRNGGQPGIVSGKSQDKGTNGESHHSWRGQIGGGLAGPMAFELQAGEKVDLSWGLQGGSE